MRIALVNTNLMRPPIAPIGLEYVAEAARTEGHEVSVIDLCLAEDVDAALGSGVRDFQPDLVGLSIRNTDDCYFAGQDFFLPRVKAMVETVRGATEAPIVLGGVGYSIAPALVLDFVGADFGISGEGEAALDLLARALEEGGDLEHVPGLVYHRDGRTVCNSREDVDLATLPARKRDLLDNSRYFAEGGQAGFETKRGCGMKCIYCADPVAHGAHVRLRPPELVVEELKALVGQGIDHFHTCDAEFNLPPGHAVAVCEEIIRAGLSDKIRWYAYCSPAPFTDDMAVLFVRAGCAGIDFGVDSGDDAMLAGLGRHFRSSDVRSTAEICARHAIPYMFDLLIGGPGETHESVRRTIGLMKEIDATRVGLSVGVRVYPGTGMADFVRQTGAELLGSRDPEFLRPVFYVSPSLGADPEGFVRGLIADDPRFFLPDPDAQEKNYNYNDNSTLVDAIRDGYRGAYWDILRRLASPR